MEVRRQGVRLRVSERKGKMERREGKSEEESKRPRTGPDSESGVGKRRVITQRGRGLSSW